MTNNDLLHLYNLEKKTFDDYGRWQSVLFSCWLVIISAPRILDLSLSMIDFIVIIDSIYFVMFRCFIFEYSKRSNEPANGANYVNANR